MKKFFAAALVVLATAFMASCSSANPADQLNAISDRIEADQNLTLESCIGYVDEILTVVGDINADNLNDQEKSDLRNAALHLTTVIYSAQERIPEPSPLEMISNANKIAELMQKVPQAASRLDEFVR